MNHRERLEACISGSVVDRPPVALWRHFPVDDQNPDNLAGSIALFQNTYDFDFVKITPASSFAVKYYGVIDEWRGNPEGTREYIHYPVHTPDDWTGLQRQSPTKGYLAQQLDCIKKVKALIDPGTPVVQTIFNPLAQAKNLVGRTEVLVHLRNHPDELLTALTILKENTLDFIQECIKIGIDGIFYAVQHAQSSLLNQSEFERFIKPFDIEILSAVKSCWLNIAHIHGVDIYFDNFIDYPVSILNWHDQETSPSLKEAKTKFTSGAVCGGLKQWKTLAYGTPESVTEECLAAIRSTEGKRFILGTGCVLPIIAPHSNILAVRKSVEIAGGM